MATQRLTVAKIIGAAATATVERFRRWSAARLVDDIGKWSHEQWPPAIRKQADAWADDLRSHSHEPPVVFFAEYIDAWSMGPPPLNPDAGLIRVVSDDIELYCLPLPIKKRVRRHLKRLRKKGQFFEDRLFGKITVNAIDVWDRVVDVGAVVFLRKVLGATVLDEEVERSAGVVPAWIVGMTQSD